jgi:transposase
VPDAHGYKKSHQADEPHLKVMAACLDTLALPIAALSAPGSCSDDELYLPVIEQAKRSLQHKGLVYVGDTKLGSLAVCGRLAGDGDFYLCPLSAPSLPKGCLAEYIKIASSAPAEQVQTLFKEGHKGDKVLTDRIFELPPVQRHRAEDGLGWTERRIMVYSLPYAQGQEKKLRDRLAKAQKEIEERFAPRKYSQKWRGGQEHLAQAFIDKVLEHYRVAPFLSATLVCPARNPTKNPLQVTLDVDEAAINLKISEVGWRPYITNVPAELMDAKQLLICYRSEYLIEHQFHKVLTKTTGLLPINLKKDNRCAALINLVLLAIQFVSIIQHKAHEEIQKTQYPMTDVVPGNKSRKVWKPSAEILLRRFKGVNAVWVRSNDGTVTCGLINFQAVHQKILDLLGCPQNLYMIYAKNCFP